MRDFWTFIGGVAVGILAVTGVFAMDEDEKPRSVEYGEEEMEDEIEGEADESEGLIVRSS